MPRIDIDDAATDGELSPGGYLADALITAAPELVEKVFHLCVCAAPKLGDSRLERAAFWRSLIETCARRDDDLRTSLALDLHEQRQPFSRDFRIGQNIFDCRELGFRQEKRIWLPVQQTVVKQFLRMNAGAEHPDLGISSLSITAWTLMIRVRDYGGQKRLSRLDDV